MYLKYSNIKKYFSDTASSNFKKILTVPPEKHKDLQGFHILGYKELIFLFGGEICWGRGNWSDNFWVYDTTRERWERKTKLVKNLTKANYNKTSFLFLECLMGDDTLSHV